MLCLRGGESFNSGAATSRCAATPRCESTTTRVLLCSGHDLAPPENLNCSREPDMERQCTLGKSYEDTSHRWQDKAGFPAAGTSFLSFCLHIVLGRSQTYRRDQRAALFPIIFLFQCSESHRPRHAANRREPYLR